ncbi:MAG: hypothetical protein ACERKZ_05835 [Lachnotalea sp.]
MDYKKMWYQIMKELSRNTLYGDENKKDIYREILVKMTELECNEVLESEEV